MNKTGIMGGTFNPIHMGHLILAERTMEELELDEVWLIPTGCSYMKQGSTDMLPGAERLAMAVLAAEGNSRIKCLDIEVKRQGYSYSYETLEQLVQNFPDTEFYFIIGADCLFAIENWKYPEKIFDCCNIAAAVRNGASLGEMEQKKKELAGKYHARIHLIPFPNLEISSTELRHRIKEGKSVRYLIPDKVLSYIVEKGFYLPDNDEENRNLMHTDV